MTFDEFYATYNGAMIDVDGVAGKQCVDLAKLFFKKVGNINYFSFGGSAKNIFENFEDFPDLVKNCTKISNTGKFAPIKGDICVWNGKVGNGDGHVAIAFGEGRIENKSTDYFYTLDQNWNTIATHKQYHTFDNFYGVLRLKDQSLVLGKESTPKPPETPYFPAYNGKSKSFVDALASLNIANSFSYRSKIAKANNISGYVGLGSQNTQMLSALKRGKLVKP